MALALSALEAKGKAEDEEAESRAHSLKNKIKLSRKEIILPSVQPALFDHMKVFHSKVGVPCTQSPPTLR